jgi:hypothetical protein
VDVERPLAAGDLLDDHRYVPDAAVVFRWADGRERHGVVEQVDRPDRLTSRWVGDDADESRVASALVPAR